MTKDPKIAVFLMGHGTKSERGAQQFLDLVALYDEQSPYRVRGGFIELASPTMYEAMEELIEQAPKHIVIIPMVLLPAGHLKDDGPELTRRTIERVPNSTTVSYGGELGLSNEILQAFTQRISSSLDKIDHHVGVLVVARGSTDNDANSDLYKASRMLSDRLGVRRVAPAFVSLAEPSVQDGLSDLASLGVKRIVVAPYFLFHGVLIDRMISQAKEWSEQSGVEVVFSAEIGATPELCDAVTFRVRQVLDDKVESSCDLCRYREIAPKTSSVGIKAR